MDEESGLVKIDDESEIQTIGLASWPCSFSFSALNNHILILEPDYHEKRACGTSSLNVIVDLMSGSIIEISKGSICVNDEIVFTKIQPILSSACDSVRNLLEL